LRALKEFPCTKCKAKIPIPQELKDELAAVAGAEAEKEAAAAANLASAPPIPFTCTKCGTKMTVKAALAGKRVRCKSCREVNMVPMPEEKEQAEAPPPLPKTEQPAAPEEKPQPAPRPEEPGGAEPAPAPEEPDSEPEPPAAEEREPAAEEKPEPSEEEEPEPVEEPKTQDEPAVPSLDAERLATLEKELHELRDEVAELKCIIAEYTDSQSEASARAATALEELGKNGPK